MHKILVCCDTFKGTLNAPGVGAAVCEGLRAALGSSVECRNIPLTDGGAGFLDSMMCALDLQPVSIPVTGPLGATIEARYGLGRNRDSGKSFAVVEMAQAAGLPLVPPPLRNPKNTTSFGVGQLIRHAMSNGVDTIFLGVGGSGTNDGGIPALQALGLRALVGGKWRDASSEPIIGGELSAITELDATALPPLRGKLVLACDVTNPFTGPVGATAVYGPQKGAVGDILVDLESGMKNISRMVRDRFGVDLDSMVGAGAAGGISGCFHVFLGAELRSGGQIFSDLVKLRDHVAWADLAISGEGCYDTQTTTYGKTVSVVHRLCTDAKKPLLIVCGQNSVEATSEASPVVFSLTPRFSLEDAKQHTAACLRTIMKENVAAVLARSLVPSI